ncbi:unnamed protein product, partial [Lymnaea stagnalis]
IISEETLRTISFFVRGVIRPPLLIVGLVTNVINIAVFLRLGLRDGLSICFFLLSLIDLLCVMLMIPTDCFYLFSAYLPVSWRTDGASLNLIIGYYYAFAYDISQAVTTYIAVQKCCCVALPFRFKHTFTRSRTVVVVSALSVICFALYLPLLTSQGLHEADDPFRNTSVLVFWTAPNWSQVYSARSTIALVLTTVCQVTVAVCLVVLASSLRASSNFRKSVHNAPWDLLLSEINKASPENSDIPSIPSKSSNEIPLEDYPKPLDGTLQNERREHTSAVKRDPRTVAIPVKTTSRKELQAVKSATLVSVIFVLCNTPKLLIFYAILCESEFNILRRYNNTYLAAITVRFTVEAFSAACNMFVYLKYNRRYRALLTSCAR